MKTSFLLFSFSAILTSCQHLPFLAGVGIDYAQRRALVTAADADTLRAIKAELLPPVSVTAAKNPRAQLQP